MGSWYNSSIFANITDFPCVTFKPKLFQFLQIKITWNPWTNIWRFFLYAMLNSIKVRVFFGKNIEKKHLCRHYKNYYYFWTSNIPVINLIENSIKWSKFQKICLCKKLDKRQVSFSPITDNFLAFFIVFEWDKILESAMDK